MSKTDLSTYTKSSYTNERQSSPTTSHGVGNLRSVLEGDGWRAAIDIDIEADNEKEVEEKAKEIIDSLSELGEIDELQ